MRLLFVVYVRQTNLELLRFVGRTHADIILTLSRPIRGELLYSNSLLSKAPQGRQKE